MPQDICVHITCDSHPEFNSLCGVGLSLHIEYTFLLKYHLKTFIESLILQRSGFYWNFELS